MRHGKEKNQFEIEKLAKYTILLFRRVRVYVRKEFLPKELAWRYNDERIAIKRSQAAFKKIYNEDKWKKLRKWNQSGEFYL